MSVEKIADMLQEIYTVNYAYSAWEVEKASKLQMNWKVLRSEQIIAIVEGMQPAVTRRAYARLSKNTRTIDHRLRLALAEGIIRGEGQAQIMRRVRNVSDMSFRQARRIVQTERRRVQSYARDVAIREAVDNGIEMQKQWIARLRRTRDLHLLVHREIVDYNETFSNGLLYPSDPQGSAANVINCFCVMKPMIKHVPPALAAHREKYRERQTVADMIRRVKHQPTGTKERDGQYGE